MCRLEVIWKPRPWKPTMEELQEHETECIPIQLTDDPKDVMLFTVAKGTTFTDDEIEEIRTFFVGVRRHIEQTRTPEPSPELADMMRE